MSGQACIAHHQSQRAAAFLLPSNGDLSPATDNLHKTLQGLALYILSTLLLSAQATMAKVLGSHGLSTLIMVLVRSLAILFGATVSLFCQKPAKPLGTKFGLLIARGLSSFASISLLYLSVQLMPLSISVVLQFLSPVMVAAAAPLILGERPNRLVWLCIPTCLGGVILIVQPSGLFGQRPANIRAVGLAVGFGQAVFAASHKLTIRGLKSEHADVQLMYLGGISVIGAAILCTWSQHFTLPASAADLTLLLLTGCVSYASQLSQTLALKLIEASLATAMSYLSVVWGLLAGCVLFGEVPNKLTVAGTVLVCSSTIILGLTEHVSANPRQCKLWRHEWFIKATQGFRYCIRCLPKLWDACASWRSATAYHRIDHDELELTSI